MCRDEDCILIGKLNILLDVKGEKAVLARAVHVDLHVRCDRRIIKRRKATIRMAKDCNAIAVKQLASEVRPGTEGADFQAVLRRMSLQFGLKCHVVEIPVVGNRDSNDPCAGFPPWQEVAVVLIGRHKDHGYVRHVPVVMVVLSFDMQCPLVKFVFCMQFVCFQRSQHLFADRAVKHTVMVRLTVLRCVTGLLQA